MKYKLYRSFGNLDKDVKKHELVGVEFGKDIDEVADALIRAVADDLAGMPEYEHAIKQLSFGLYSPQIEEHTN